MAPAEEKQISWSDPMPPDVAERIDKMKAAEDWAGIAREFEKIGLLEPRKTTRESKQAIVTTERPRGNDALPLDVVRRAVEKGMAQGYFYAMADLGMYRSEKGRKHLPELTQKVLSEDEPLDPTPEIYEQIATEHVSSLRNFNGWDMVEICIREVQRTEESSSLAEANAVIKKRGGRVKGARGNRTNKLLRLFDGYIERGRSKETAITSAVRDYCKAHSRAKAPKIKESLERAINMYRKGGE